MSYIVHLREKLRLIGQYAMPILTVTAMMASPGSAIAGIATTPYTDTFEEYTNGTPLVDGTNGWYGSSSDIIVTNIVHTNFGVISTNMAMIPTNCTLSNRCESTNNIGIWMNFDANLAFYNGESQPAVDTNLSAVFYVDSNGDFVVHNGAPYPTPTNSVNWVTLKTNVAGQAITQLLANTSVRINLRQNYADKNWALYANNVLLTNAIGFINPTSTNFAGFDTYNGDTTSYLDNVHIVDWPAMEVSPTNISRVIWQGQDAGSNKVEVWNKTGTDAMAFTVSYTNYDVLTNWLTVSPVMGTNYGAAQKSAIWLRMDTTSLPPRTNAYEANVQVTAEPGTTDSPQNVQVTVLVQGVAELGVAPTNFSTKAVTVGQGDVFDEIKVANTGAAPRGTMSYTLTTTNTWLSVSPTNGDAQNDTNTVNLRYLNLTTNLSAGWYTGRVDVVALGVGTQSVGVSLRVNNRPGVAWNAESNVWTNVVMAGDGLGSTTVEVWNASRDPAGQMNYAMSVLEDPSGWVSGVSPVSGSSTGNHQFVTVSYRTTGLVAGVYSARLKVAGTDAATGEATTNGPLYMGLQLTVKGTPGLKTDATSLSMTVLENYTGSTNFQVWNEGRDPRGGMSYTVTRDVSWVTVSPTTGVVTNNTNSLVVVCGTTTLPPGTYSGNLVVTATDAQHPEISAGGSPLTIPLTLTVTARTPTNMELPTVMGTLYIGQTVEANPGLWQNQSRLTFSYQWERAANKAGGGWETLAGKVSITNDITTGDRGKYLRVKVTATDSAPFSMSSTAYSAWTNSAKVKALPADFNGDGITDLWFYDEAIGTWHASFGTTDSAEGIFPGGPGMIAMPGDYDGDGYEDLGVYEGAHGMWHIYYLPRGAYVYGSLFGGTAEEAAATPVAADFDGDGATDVGLYYMGYWAILYSSLGAVSVIEPFADAWCEPVSGDWDGDGTTEMGVYNDGVWTLRFGNGSVVEQEFGGEGSWVLPAPADYDADGATDLGVYDVGANQWRWRESRTGFEQSLSFGSGGTLAIPGYYDHDRSNDWAQVFPYNNDFIVWEVKRTTETNFPYRGQSFQQSTDRWRVSW